jgi:SAM-dependent methyltransferase
MMLLSSNNMRSSSTSSSFLSTTRSSPAPNFWIASAIGAIFLSPPDLIERWLPMIAPFPTTFNEYQHRRIVNKILNDCWTNDDNSSNTEEGMKIKNYGFELESSDDWIVDNQNQNQNQNEQVIRITKQKDDFDDDYNDNDEMENRYRNQDMIEGTKRDPATTIKSTDSIFLNYFLCLHLLFSLPSSLIEEKQDGNDNDIFANDTDNTMPSMMMKNRKKTTMIMKPSTYGEITPLGARQLFGAMGLYDYNRSRYRYRKSQHSDSDADDADDDGGVHFYDLGSGTGKLVAQAVLELSSPLLGKTTLKKATGIELSPSRHKSAIQSKQNTLNTLGNTKKLKSLFSSSSSSSSGQQYEYNIYNATANNIINDNINNRLELIQGDLFDIDLSTATHIYIASLCFPDNLMLKLEERLMTLVTSISKQQQQEDRDRDDENDNHNNGEKDDTITTPATKRSRSKKQNQQHKQQQQLQCIATLRKFPNDLGGIKPTKRYMEMSWTSPLGSAVYLYHVSSGRIV